jgi:PAS domain S-box-containing protein
MSNKMKPHFCNLILDSIPVAIVTMDADLKITSFNSPAEDLTGYSTSEAMGKPCSQILHNKRCDSECPLQTLKEFGESTTGIEAELVNRYGEHIPVRISAASIQNENAAHIGYLETIEDISREKALERERHNFLFMLAHDMKSPLVSILGLIKRIREHHDDMSAEKLELFCTTIKDSGEQLEDQVMEFLEFSRQETNQIKLKLEYVDLPELLDKLILRHKQQTAEKRSLAVLGG